MKHHHVALSLRRFASAVAAAQVKVEAAQLAANALKHSYNSNNSRCDAEPWTQQYCAAAADGWLAYLMADDELSTATAALAAVTAGPVAGRLAAARAEMTAAQQAVSEVIAGDLWVGREAAFDAWMVAEDAANAVADKGSEGAALTAANAALRSTQQALSAVNSDSSPEWQALSAAVTGFKVATARVHAARAAATLGGTTQQLAVTELRKALADVATGSFLNMSSLYVNFTLNKSSVMLYAYYGMTVFGQRMSGNFAIDVNNSPQELKLMVMDVLVGDVLRAVKTAYKDTQQFLL
jgi:hypothetical protein